VTGEKGRTGEGIPNDCEAHLSLHTKKRKLGRQVKGQVVVSLPI